MHKRTITSILHRKTTTLKNSLKLAGAPATVIECVDRGIVTGGCIVSMLLDEKVSDYDLYFASVKDAEVVMEWAADRFNTKNRRGDRMKPAVEIRLDQDNAPYFFIKSSGIAAEAEEEGGGAVYEFFENVDHPERTAAFMRGMFGYVAAGRDQREAYEPVFFSQNAIGLAPPKNKDGVAPAWQFIVRFSGTADQIHESFDYVHCTNWYSIADKQLYLRQAAIESIMSKTLLYTGSQFPVCSILRARKFIKRGWNINAGQYLRMCLQISKLDLYDLETLQRQLTGVDAAYFAEIFSQIAAAEREQDGSVIESERVDEGYLAQLIEKLFD